MNPTETPNQGAAANRPPGWAVGRFGEFVSDLCSDRAFRRRWMSLDVRQI